MTPYVVTIMTRSREISKSGAPKRDFCRPSRQGPPHDSGQEHSGVHHVAGKNVKLRLFCTRLTSNQGKADTKKSKFNGKIDSRRADGGCAGWSWVNPCQREDGILRKVRFFLDFSTFRRFQSESGLSSPS